MAVSAVLLASGCSDDSSSDASAAAAPTATPGFGRATASDLARLDLPVYADASPSDSDLSKSPKNNGYTMTLMLTTRDAYAAVDAWYAAHLDSEFKGSRLGSPRDGQSSVYSDSEPDDAPPTLQRSVTIDSAKDATGKAIVIVTLRTMSTSTEIPKKDWH